MLKTIYCGNCGKKGHIYKKCLMPIISLGIICISYENADFDEIIKSQEKKDMVKDGNIFNCLNEVDQDRSLVEIINSKLKFLMIRRKYTLSFIEFVRGNYNFNSLEDIKYLKYIFSQMTVNEREIIKKEDIIQLWNNLWISKDNNHSHIKEFEQSKNKFNKLKKGIYFLSTSRKIFISLDYLLKHTTSTWLEQEWGFPKGRRNICESDKDCAMREFMEETNFSKEDFKLIDINPISETFMGSNGINYKHIYYFAQSTRDIIPRINPDSIHQRIEIDDIQWFTYTEALNKIRHYDKHKTQLINKVYKKFFAPLWEYFT